MKESLKKIEELKNQLNAVKSELQKEFKDELKKIFVDNPTLDSIEMSLNNHEFNDGDATSFYIGYEDMNLMIDLFQKNKPPKLKQLNKQPIMT